MMGAEVNGKLVGIIENIEANNLNSSNGSLETGIKKA